MRLLLSLILALSFSSLLAEKKLVSLDEAYLEGLKLRNIMRIEESDLIFDSIVQSKADPLILLEIGRLYYQERKFGKAKLVFQTAKDNFELTPVVKKKVERYLQDISHHSGYWSYNFSIVSTKNPKRKPDSGVYSIFGVPLQFHNAERKNYLGVNHDIAFHKKLNNSIKITTNFNVLDYQEGDFDRQSIQIIAQETNMFPDLVAEYFLSYDNVSDSNLSTYGGQLYTKNIYTSFSLVPSIGYYFLNHSAEGYRKGTRLDISVKGNTPFHDPNSNIDIRYIFENYQRKTNSQSSGLIKFDKIFFFSKIQVIPSLQFAYTRFAGYDPTWNKTREDFYYEGKIKFCPKNFSNKNVNSICLAFTKENRESNIPFYKYQEDGLSVSFAKTF